MTRPSLEGFATIIQMITTSAATPITAVSSGLSAARAPATSASASSIDAGSPPLGLPVCMPSALRTLRIWPAASGLLAIPTPMSRISQTQIQSRPQ